MLNNKNINYFFGLVGISLLLTFSVILFLPETVRAQASWPRDTDFKISLNQNTAKHWGKENAQIFFALYKDGNTENEVAGADLVGITDAGCDLKGFHYKKNDKDYNASLFVREVGEYNGNSDRPYSYGRIAAERGGCPSNGIISFQLTNGKYVSALDKTIYRATAFISFVGAGGPEDISPPDPDGEDHVNKITFRIRVDYSHDPKSIGFLRGSYLPYDTLDNNGRPGPAYPNYKVDLMRSCTDNDRPNRWVSIKDYDGNKAKDGNESLISLTHIQNLPALRLSAPGESRWESNSNYTYTPKNVPEDVIISLEWNFLQDRKYTFQATNIASTNFINFRFPVDEWPGDICEDRRTLSADTKVKLRTSDNWSDADITVAGGSRVDFQSSIRTSGIGDGTYSWSRTRNGNSGWPVPSAFTPNWNTWPKSGSTNVANNIGPGQISVNAPPFNSAPGANNRYCISTNITGTRPAAGVTITTSPDSEQRCFTVRPPGPEPKTGFPDTDIDSYEKGSNINKTVSHKVCNPSPSSLVINVRIEGFGDGYPASFTNVTIPYKGPCNIDSNYTVIRDKLILASQLDTHDPGGIIYSTIITAVNGVPQTVEHQGILTVYEVPYARFYGSDVYSGATPYFNADEGLGAYATGKGSVAQYAVFAADQTAGIAGRKNHNNINLSSAGFRPPLSSPPMRADGLKAKIGPPSVSNIDSLCNGAGNPWPGSLSSVSDGACYNLGSANLSISGGYGTNRITIITIGTVNITSNITNSGPSGGKIPILIIKANNINIENDVTQIDAILIASHSSGGGGDINTCYNISDRSKWHLPGAAGCRNNLTINGALYAGNTINFQRSIGTRLKGVDTEDESSAGKINIPTRASTVDKAAEIVNFPAYLYFATPATNNPNNDTDMSIRSYLALPPRL